MYTIIQITLKMYIFVENLARFKPGWLDLILETENVF